MGGTVYTDETKALLSKKKKKKKKPLTYTGLYFNSIYMNMINVETK